jgi:RNA polymerase sigma-70 factor (ECF subfamily)
MVVERAAELEELFRAHHQDVWAYAARRVGRGDASDVVSETFITAFRKIEQRPRDALPWLLAIARRICANHIRASRRREALVVSLRQASLAVPRTERELSETLILIEAFSSLSSSEQGVLMLVAWDGLTPGRAARILGCSVAAFLVRLHRARRRLAARLAVVDEIPKEHGEERELRSLGNRRSPA